MSVIPYGYCQCGCGGKTTVIAATDKKRNRIKGEPSRFLKGHQWGNKGKIENYGYIMIFQDDHPRANNFGYVYEHILVMEKSLGRNILPTEAIHHIDGNPKNNAIWNLMLFATNAMHSAFHYRLKAFEKCGHYEWRSCVYCHQWSDPKDMVNNGAKSMCHAVCRRDYQRERYPIRHERDKRNKVKREMR